MAQISLKNVYKAYYSNRQMSEARMVLNNIDLNIEEGEFVSLLGPSGCGKTTVLNLIAGFEKPTKGEVTFKGQPIKGPSPERGVVFQEFSLFPWMTVRSNIELALECKNIPEKERRGIAEEALNNVRMSQFYDYRPNTLSGGMKQRVAIARLLAMDSEVFLMDEPFSALDEQTRRALDEDLVKLWQEKRKTVVFVTHSVEEAILVSTRIIMFSDSPGEIIGEWDLRNRTSRDITLKENAELKKEIIDTLPLCSCRLRR
ncbi:MAG: ABC transporter ATP-binding protein [Candidatus Methanomethylophilaceae archaeon]|nr:ABC transporter ATP-binding protein [Candidatus Methanomethylophilaceae archaeon]